MSKRPAFQFYPGDWRTDAGLRLCSIGARGLWIEMMCLMHEGEPYGHLTSNGRPLTVDQIARLCGETSSKVRKFLSELETNEVFSSVDGVIFSRRMVNDERIREARAAGGESGGKHGHKGAEHGSKGGRPKAEITPLPDDERGDTKPPPSSSSSSPSPEGIPLSKDNGVDPEKLLFDTGVQKLMGEGKTEGAARALVGKWKKDLGVPAAIEGLGAAHRLGITDTPGFMAARSKAMSNNGYGPGHSGIPI